MLQQFNKNKIQQLTSITSFWRCRTIFSNGWWIRTGPCFVIIRIVTIVSIVTIHNAVCSITKSTKATIDTIASRIAWNFSRVFAGKCNDQTFWVSLIHSNDLLVIKSMSSYSSKSSTFAWWRMWFLNKTIARSWSIFRSECWRTDSILSHNWLSLDTIVFELNDL